MAEVTTLGALLSEARRRLAAAGIEGAALDARLLVEHFAGASRTDLVTRPERPVSADAAAAVLAAIARRAAHEPVHRILGWREFHGLKLALSPETLEPRADTEALVDAVLPFVRETARRKGSCRILDLGTGTGAIALALLKEEPRATAVGADLSGEALRTARANAEACGLAARFATARSDWFEKIEGRFHLIASNPPYIESEAIEALQPEVRLFDPRAALDGGRDGLDAYRIIAAGAAGHLEDGGRIALEIGHRQKDAVEALFGGAGYRLSRAVRDLGGNDRVLVFSLADAPEIKLGKADEHR
ncbi:MAG: peptide chain release factor N(5)-glutamine methyltransferase [Rhizobiaceae bacterium]|nr:MAG: peptide chain release factor N(5)-glutamine methyltransferase [Rhizobiaceae bacterium]CAG0999100.1 Release factor glutamine methyltransferase [Rhizobiaceae bacterium]